MTDALQEYVSISATIPGWLEGEDAEELARVSYRLPDDAIIVEIGTFFGRSAVLLAGARRLRGSGKVHCIDPFDCSGDAFSVPYYSELLKKAGGGSLREHFEANIRRAGLSDWVAVHQGRATEIAATWTTPIDLLLIDGDQSPTGARAAYESWAPFLKPGGIIVLRNSAMHEYAEGHDGHRRLALDEIVSPRYFEIRQVQDSTFARKSMSPHALPAARDGGIRLFTAIYDDVRLLPHFLSHYKKIGVTEFFIGVTPGLESAVTEFQPSYNIVLVEDVDVSDSFCGGNSAVTEMRRRYQRPDEWVIIVDLDEFLEIRGPITDILRRAEEEAANVVRGVMWDRLSGDGRVVGFDRDSDLTQIYPVRVRLTQKLMLGTDFKGVLVKGLRRGLAAHHIFESETVHSEILDISHYKWNDRAIERVAAAHEIAVAAGKDWAVEYARVLDHYRQHGRFAWEEFDGELDLLLEGCAAEDSHEPERGTKDPLRAIGDISATIPGWTRDEDAEEVARAGFSPHQIGETSIIGELITELENYRSAHEEMLELSDQSNFLIFSTECFENGTIKLVGGFADRIKGLLSCALLAILTHRALLVEWPRPVPILDHFTSPKIALNMPEITHKINQPDLFVIDAIDTKNHNEFYNYIRCHQNVSTVFDNKPFAKIHSNMLGIQDIMECHLLLSQSPFGQILLRLMNTKFRESLTREIMPILFTFLLSYHPQRAAAQMWKDFQARRRHSPFIGTHFRSGGDGVWVDPVIDDISNVHIIDEMVDRIAASYFRDRAEILITSDSSEFRTRLFELVSGKHPVHLYLDQPYHYEHGGNGEMLRGVDFAVFEFMCLSRCDFVIHGKGGFGVTAAMVGGKPHMPYHLGC